MFWEYSHENLKKVELVTIKLTITSFCDTLYTEKAYEENIKKGFAYFRTSNIQVFIFKQDLF